MIFEFKQVGRIFSFNFNKESKTIIPTSEWAELNEEHLSQLSILNELNENGLAEFTDKTCDVETLEILRLSQIDKKILELPDSYPFEIYIESDGVLTHNSFKFKYGFYDFCPNGTRLIAERNGGIITIDNCDYLLSENQYSICEAIDEFNGIADSEKGNLINLKKLTQLKKLSEKSGIILDNFLNNQELYTPEKIKLDIDFQNGVLEIFPTVDIENSFAFTNSFDKLPIIRDVYPISGSNGKTTRILIPENQKSDLRKVKQFRKVTNKETIQNIIEHPEFYFQESDFSVFFSERVKEIGIYNPKFYPFASPYKSEWIPGIVVKDKIHGEKRIYFKSEEVLHDFIQEKDKAVVEKKQTVDWENTEIPIEEADKLIINAKKQFENTGRPQKQDNKSDNEVLIIKENAELTEYSFNNELPEKIHHKFYGINNLIDSIDLKEHQKEGVSWLQSLFIEKYPGGLLADDMGLGKTLQLLYFIEWHSQHCNDTKPYLIVAPVSLLENWENEYLKFFNPQNLPLNKLYGSVGLTKEYKKNQNLQDAKSLQSKQIILTNYETIRSYQISLGLVDFAIIALDEAQKIKTPGTLITNASKALKADFKIAMTGTPVENTLVDIWCIMDFAVPGLLGNAKEFAKKYQKPLNDKNVDIKGLTEQLRKTIGEFIKRRLKRDVAKDLPNKHDNSNSRIRSIMPSIQLERYKQEIELANDGQTTGVDKKNQKLKSLWAVRDISDHPYLIDSQILNFTSEQLISTSAKLQRTIDILFQIKQKNQKVIVFADRKNTQRMLQKVFYETFAISSSIINGDTPTSQKKVGKSNLSRQQTIDRFQEQEGFNIIIMSPIAAGVGLNVTKANHIIHYTRHWNPAKEEQATDRAYRIGQQHDVFVYYPMAVFPDEMKDEHGNKLKSFDEILDTLLNNKKALASNTLFPSEQAEVAPDELYGNIFGRKTESTPRHLMISDIDKLHPNLFEACIASLFVKQGFQTYLTPYSNDKGVDVVALKDGENVLIQVKQSKSLVGNDAIKEIFTAKKYYEDKFKEKFDLMVVSNNNYSSSAEILAKSNGISLIRRSNLERMSIENKITLLEINRHESQRLSRI